MGGIGEESNWITNKGLEGAPAYYLYTTSFYWAVMTLTTIGYGDVSAGNYVEQICASVIMLMGGGAYAYVVGGISSTLANMNPEKADFHAAVDQLNELMNEHQCTEALKFKMRHFFNNSKNMHREKYKLEIIRLMSPGLQCEFTTEAYAPFIKVHPRSAHTRFVRGGGDGAPS